MRYLIPHIARHTNWKEHLWFLLLGLATIYEGLVITFSLGFLNVETRLYLLLNDDWTLDGDSPMLSRSEQEDT